MLTDKAFIAKMESLERRHKEVSALLADPDTFGRPEKLAKLSKEHSELSDLVGAWHELSRLQGELADARAMADEAQGDPEMRQLARDEIARLEEALKAAENRLRLLLLPKDPNDDKNILLEIRAGTGGDEAALFAGDLFRMYLRFAEQRGWKAEVLSLSEGGSGGVKEAIVLITGKEVYSQLKYESGVHRVQRVPATESQGRIHTSAATVAVLPEAEEVDVKIDPNDLRIDVMRAGGPGGQSVNTTDSAVRITHIPTGIVAFCQDEKSQHKNKAKAMTILRSRVLDLEVAKQQAEQRAERQALVKTGDRSEKIRTYNFPQDRVTDHRLGLTKHNLPGILDGDLGDIIDALRAHDQAEALQRAESL